MARRRRARDGGAGGQVKNEEAEKMKKGRIGSWKEILNLILSLSRRFQKSFSEEEMWSGERRGAGCPFDFRPPFASSTTTLPNTTFPPRMPPLKRPNSTAPSNGKSHKRTKLQQGRQITSKQPSSSSSSSRAQSSPAVGKGNDAALKGESSSRLPIS